MSQLPTDASTQKIVKYLVEKSFNSVHVLSCVADIARAIGQNPRTVQNRLQQLMDKNVVKVIDSYPRDGRSMVSIYQLNRPATSVIVNPNVDA